MKKYHQHAPTPFSAFRRVHPAFPDFFLPWRGWQYRKEGRENTVFPEGRLLLLLAGHGFLESVAAPLKKHAENEEG
jgi:hypothetical protein